MADLTARFDPRRFETFVVILGSGALVGSSGIGIVNGKVIHIPGNNPEAFDLIGLGFEALRVSTAIQDKALQEDLEKQSAKLIKEGQSILEKSVKTAMGKAA
jgi:hypothetical protein